MKRLLWLLLTVPLFSVGAQGPLGADRMTPFAAAESLRVLKTIDRDISGSKDAALWYRRGNVAWALYERARREPPVRGLYWQSLTTLADTSLRRALELDPENSEYFVAVAHFLLESGVSYRTYGAYGVFNDELKRVRATGSPDAIARTASEAARLYWVRYDREVCNKAIEQGDGMPFTGMEGGPALNPFMTKRAVDYSGETDYLKAELMWRESYDAAPTEPKTFKQLAMLLADHRRWIELRTLARDHIERVPRDGWGWMSMGLSEHRLAHPALAVAAFDSGLRVLGDSVRRFLDRFERVLDSTQRGFFDPVAAEAKQRMAALYWRNQDPVWSVDGTEPRTEFLARVTYAQLRWSADENSLDGVTSDFGNNYVKTGRFEAFEQRDGDRRQDLCVPQAKPYWVAGDTMVLKTGPRAQWAGILHGMRVDSMPAQAARFRATRDSTDIFVATLPPVALIQRMAQVKGPVRTDFWLLAEGTDDVARDSVRPAVAGVQKTVHRVPAGMYIYRAEASADASPIASRATASLIAGDDPRTGYTTHDFGISDIVVTSQIAAGGTPRRWTDLNFMPLVGPVVKKAQFGVLWEAYDLRNENGSARYEVKITLSRDSTRSLSGRIAASIVGSLSRVAGVQRGKDKIEITYERTAPHADVIPDYITVALGDTPAGQYLLTLTITDRASGMTTGRSQILSVFDPSARPAVGGAAVRR